ncbi:MAG: hypothetical protein CR984_07820 [Proteobacteria bacterium]|nr:MAG: hypothetical protein CR984_07820 [Pseudomonadota bacterium]
MGDIALRMKKALQLPVVKIVGDPNRTIDTVAICSGSGSSLLPDAIATGAQVYLSGDIGYHTARDAQQAGIGIIDIGHFTSEQPIVDSLVTVIRGALVKEGIRASVAAAKTEKDPFEYR